MVGLILGLTAARADAQWWWPLPWNPFAPSAQVYALTIQKTGTGTGTVNGNLINCGATCTHVFTRGVQVTLSAAPTADSVLVSWSGGGCSGNGTCVVTMDGVKTITATFNFFWRLTWTDNANNETGQQIDRQSPCPSGIWNFLVALPQDQTVYDDTSAVPATSYGYRVSALNSGGASGYATACSP